jgi:hypothetical protein
MIYIQEEQVAQVEYLIRQSMLGNHILFSQDQLRAALNTPLQELEPKEDCEAHLEKLMGLPTLREKKLYLERLDRKITIGVIQTYFHIVENNLFESAKTRH